MSYFYVATCEGMFIEDRNKNMQRQFCIKRSFNCKDFSSIVGLDQHHQLGDNALENSPRKRTKRQRTLSTHPSPSSAVYGYCEEKGEMFPANITSSAPSHGSLEPEMPSMARLISPATSHVAVTPELTPAHPSIGLPCFPPLQSRARIESCDFPATAALERFVLKQRCTNQPLEDIDSDFSPSFEDECDEDSFRLWPKFDDREGMMSPCQVEDFPREMRRVSMASRKSSSVSDENSSHDRPSMASSDGASKALMPPKTTSFNMMPFSFLAVTSSPTKAISQQQVPTVNQITESFARM